MELKVKHDDLDKLNKTMKSDSEILDEEINSMNEQIEKLRTVWIGRDSKIFCDNFQDYLSKMKHIPVAIHNISSFISKANNGYKDNDEKFAKELDKEAYNYDEDGTTDNEFRNIQ